MYDSFEKIVGVLQWTLFFQKHKVFQQSELNQLSSRDAEIQAVVLG